MLFVATWLTAQASVGSSPASAATFNAPPTVVVGQQVDAVAAGFAPGRAVAVLVRPALNRGGNCCGIVVSRHLAVRADGTVQVSFVMPDAYASCGGAENCSSVAWERDEAVDIDVFEVLPDGSPLPDGAFATSSSLVEVPGSSEDLALAARFRPVLLFDSSEPWRPLDVARMFLDDRPSVCARAGCYPSASISGLTYSRRLDTPGRPEKTDSYGSGRPECRHGGLADCDSGLPAGMYAHTVYVPSASKYAYIDYWWYFRFNDAPGGGIFDHEGDWEGTTIAVSGDEPDPQRFVFAAIASHEARWNYLREVLKCAGADEGDTCEKAQRVKVFVANGTHAGYPDSCKSFWVIPLCGQTGHAGLIPEAGFDGQRPWGANDAPESLRDLNRPWVDWDGSWNADPGTRIASPGKQSRFSNPWRSECPGVFPSSACERAAAAQTRAASDCDSWFGPFVEAAACDPELLEQAIRDGTLGQPGTLSVQVDGTRQASAPGIAQAVGEGLAAGQTATLVNPGPDTELRVRTADANDSLSARYTGLAGAGTVIVEADNRRGQPRLRARRQDGRVLRPASVRRTTIRRPARPRAVRATRRGNRVVVTFRTRAPRAAVQLASRGGRLVATRIVRVPTAGRRTVSVAGARAARSVTVRALNAIDIPSRPVAVRIR